MTPIPIQSNQLGSASSPYLIQHADNPVHWQEWSQETLDRAKASNKPILLSIGYAACHWCHVMAHESFEDNSTADLMNEYFINIKVDREERPDIDQIYMAALHALGEQGGWPLTMFLKPDRSPFWGGTYFPPVPAHGRPSFKQVLKSIHSAFENNTADVNKNAEALNEHLKRLSKLKPSSEAPNKSSLQHFRQKTLNLYDPVHGGMKGAPKFPNAPFLEVWARAANAKCDNAYAEAFTKTIRQISLGGIYDHFGGGIARYSVDEKWLVPHFEKMLYDNAHYLRHLLWCWQFTEEKLFRVRIEETISWLTSEMLLPQGAFASSLDADSEGIEGKFYVWKLDEIQKHFENTKQATDFCEKYDISEEGNWEGNNIPNLSNAVNIDETYHSTYVEKRNFFLSKRAERIRPGQDDKILADWNGYLIRALAEISSALNKPEYLQVATKAFRFISESNNLPLFHSTRGEATIRPAMATDYAAMINAALSLYEASFDESYLNTAEKWLCELDEYYSDNNGGYFLTSKSATDLLVRPRADQDEANSSASSLILEALIRYANLSGKTEYLQKAEALSINQESISKVNQYGMAGYMNALDSYFNHIHILICGENNDSCETLLQAARNVPRLAKSISVNLGKQSKNLYGYEIPSDRTKPFAIICSNQTCSKALNSTDELIAYIKGQSNTQ